MDAINKRPSDVSLMLFLSISFCLLLCIGQDEVIDRGSLFYWLMLLPALLLPLTKVHYLIYNVFSKTWPILFMLLISIIWGLVRHDLHAVFRLALFLMVLSWMEIASVTIRTQIMMWMYLSCVLISVYIYLGTDINYWGLIPGTTAPGNGLWRVSFFPNIANTGFFSLFIFMLGTKDKETFKKYKWVVFLSLYFAIFSFVRTAVISLLAYLVLRLVFHYIKNPRLLFFGTLLITFILNFLVGYAAEIVHTIQTIPLISRLFLRGNQLMSQHDIYVQMYRPWVWQNQWNIFVNSPLWMGEGLYNFNDYINSSFRGEHLAETDSVSLLLGLLASYGLAALLFFYYIVKKVYLSAMDLDKWACAIFPIIIFICMQWGCIFHPACATFVIFFLILLKGKRAFP